MSEKVKVLVTATQAVHFRKVIEMTREEWIKIKTKPGDEITDISDIGLGYEDIYNSEALDWENEDFDMEVVEDDAGRRKARPADSWTGVPEEEDEDGDD